MSVAEPRAHANNVALSIYGLLGGLHSLHRRSGLRSVSQLQHLPRGRRRQRWATPVPGSFLSLGYSFMVAISTAKRYYFFQNRHFFVWNREAKMGPKNPYFLLISKNWILAQFEFPAFKKSPMCLVNFKSFKNQRPSLALVDAAASSEAVAYASRSTSFHLKDSTH